MEIEGYTLEEEIFRGWKVFLFFFVFKRVTWWGNVEGCRGNGAAF